MSTETPEFELDDRVIDKVAENNLGRDAGVAIVVDIHEDTRADEFIVSEDTLETLDEMVKDWPSDALSAPGYDSGEDYVVDVVFEDSLAHKFGAAWIEWDAEQIKDACERNDLIVYSFHANRLEHEHNTPE